MSFMLGIKINSYHHYDIAMQKSTDHYKISWLHATLYDICILLALANAKRMNDMNEWHYLVSTRARQLCG